MKNQKIVLNETPELTTVSSKGQVVIPHELREKLHIEKGNVFAVTPFDDMLVMKKIGGKLTEEERETLKDIKDAWEEVEQGRFTVSTKEEFLEKLEKW